MIKATALSKAFGRRKVLRDLELSIDKGEIVALIGSNGAGKTTLIRILCSLIRPDSGLITFDGIDLSGNPMQVRKRLGVVLHSLMLYPNLTARENLQFYCRLFALENPEERINQMLIEMNLFSRGDNLVRTFSRGMQQRLSIGRSMLHDPNYLLMDEPYTGLDENSSDSLDILLKRQIENGKSILLTTHDLERVFKVATRVDILHHGKILFSCPVSQINYQDLVSKYGGLTKNSIADLNKKVVK
jgi:heme exporter protein A